MFVLFSILMATQTYANPPECPLYKDKGECLRSVESNYNNFLDFINQSTDDEDANERDKLLQASLDIKKYESLACQRTCLN